MFDKKSTLLYQIDRYGRSKEYLNKMYHNQDHIRAGKTATNMVYFEYHYSNLIESFETVKEMLHGR